MAWIGRQALCCVLGPQCLGPPAAKEFLMYGREILQCRDIEARVGESGVVNSPEDGPEHFPEAAMSEPGFEESVGVFQGVTWG